MIIIFDLDDTLVISAAKIKVCNKKTGECYSLTPEEFNTYEKGEHEELNFDEFNQKIDNVIYLSATPGDYEMERTDQIVEQIIRPTGLLDPVIEVRQKQGQIDDLVAEILERIKKNQRTLITTLTIKMSEDLTTYLKEIGM